MVRSAVSGLLDRWKSFGGVIGTPQVYSVSACERRETAAPGKGSGRVGLSAPLRVRGARRVTDRGTESRSRSGGGSLWPCECRTLPVALNNLDTLLVALLGGLSRGGWRK